VLFSWSFSKPYSGPVDTYAKFKALYIYNFPKYLEWPEDYKKGNFVISVLGNNSNTVAELNKIIAGKSIGDQAMEIKLSNSIETLTKCQMLVIASDKSDQLSKVITKLKGKSTLIISEKEGAAKLGSMVNFVIKDGKQKFELNVGSIEKSNLKLSKTLLNQAIEVN
jgi:hypothetical protein